MTTDAELTSPQPAEPVVEPPAVSTLERIVGTFFSPVETFRSIAARPNILAPLIILFVLFLAVGATIASRIDFASAVRDKIASRPDMKPEQAERMIRFSSSIARGFAYASPVISIIGLLVMAGVLLLVFRLFGGDGDFPQAFSVVLYTSFVSAIESILRTIVIVARGGMVSAEALPNLLRSNLGFLTDLKEHPMLFALLSSFDVFNVWMLALLIVGFAFVSRLSRMQSAAIVGGLWLLVVVFKVGMAALQGLGDHA